MKSLNTLIKLHKKQIDDILLQINAIERQIEGITAQMNLMLDQFHKEIATYSGNIEYGFILDNYRKSVNYKKQIYINQIKNLTTTVDNLREDLFEKFSELKKLEIARDRRLLEEQKLENKRENLMLDENTVLRYARKN